MTDTHIAPTSQPPYYAVIFTSQLSGEDEEGYLITAEQLRKLAEKQDGYLGYESVTEGSREITVSYWTSLEAINRWKQDASHLQAQRNGKETWYKAYCVRVSRVEKAYRSE